MHERFWPDLDQLVAQHAIVVDRARGTAHPRYPDFVYPLDYGYLEGTRSMDGGGIDVWLGSLPERTVRGVIATVDLKKGDSEMKLLIGCTPEEAEVVLAAHNAHTQAGLLVLR
jgi:inorganic pyrophosphatase